MDAELEIFKVIGPYIGESPHNTRHQEENKALDAALKAFESLVFESSLLATGYQRASQILTNSPCYRTNAKDLQFLSMRVHPMKVIRKLGLEKIIHQVWPDSLKERAGLA